MCEDQTTLVRASFWCGSCRVGVVEKIIDVSGLSKQFRQYRRYPGFRGALKSLITTSYDDVVAVEDTSFSLAEGEAVGYLGANGAGKSTMIKMLTGVLVPTAGDVKVLGRTPYVERVRNAQEIGVVFGQRSQLWWDLPVIDSFKLHKAIYQIDDRRFQKNLNELSGLLELGSYINRPVRQLSLGQRMRAEIVMALLHDPKILFLDEPTIGLDVVAKDAVRRFLATVNRQHGVTIILTTHDLQDVEQICPRIIMVDHGRQLFDGSLQRLRSELGAARRLILEFHTDPGPVTLSSCLLISDEGVRKHFLVKREDVSLVDIFAELGSYRELRDVAMQVPNIEEVIRSYYTRCAGR